MPATQPLDLIHDPARVGVLMDPLRLRLVEELASGPDSAAGLARRLGLPRQKLNYHLRELERGGFVALVEERRKGNCVERIVGATARAFVIDPGVLGALGLDTARFQDRFSSSYLVAVAAGTIRDLAALRQRADAAGKKLATLTLETRLTFKDAERRAAFFDELSSELTRLVARYHHGHTADGRTFKVVVGSYPSPAPATGPGGANEPGRDLDHQP